MQTTEMGILLIPSLFVQKVIVNYVVNIIVTFIIRRVSYILINRLIFYYTKP